MKGIYEGNMFYLAKEQEGRNPNLPSIIKTSGYTIDKRAIRENWLLTQMRTLPHRDRSHLPDPVILENFKGSLAPYAGREVYSLYLKPGCIGIKYVQDELSRLINSSSKDFSFVGHSKGGLIIAGLTIKKPSKFVFIAPTFGTVMGNEAAVFKEISDYKATHFHTFIKDIELGMYESLIHLIGSRRPVDFDMVPDSKFLNELDLEGLHKHKVLLITATCPQGKCGFKDAFFRRLGSYLNLDKDGDGMVSLTSQRLIQDYADYVINISATHPTVLGKTRTIKAINKFLKKTNQ